jgi:hypothetical protein
MDRVEELQSMNYEMLDYLRTQLVWLLEYCKKNPNLPIPRIHPRAFISNFFGAFGRDLGHVVSHELQPTFPFSYIGNVIMISGLGLINCKVYGEKFGIRNIRESD